MTLNQNGVLLVEANKIEVDTTVSKIVKLVEDAQISRLKFKISDKISKYFKISIVIHSTLTFIMYFIC